MFGSLGAFDCYILAAIALVGTLGASVVVLWVSQRSRYAAVIRTFHGVAPPFLGIPGILFALNLVFLANDTWNAHDRALTAVSLESGAIKNIGTVAGHLPAAAQAAVMAALRKYAQDAVTLEWPLLAWRQSSPVVEGDVQALLSLVSGSAVAGALESNTHAFLIQQVAVVGQAHSQRVILSRTHVNPLKWLGMAFLGFITMVAIVMVHVDHVRAALLAVLLFAAAGTPTAVIVLVQGNPFQQPTAVAPLPIACAAALSVPGAGCD